MPDVYYCHGCGSIHKVEAIRRDLHVAGRPVGDPTGPLTTVLVAPPGRLRKRSRHIGDRYRRALPAGDFRSRG